AGGRDDLSDGIGGLFAWTAVREEMCAATALAELAFRCRAGLRQSELRWVVTQATEHAQTALKASRAAGGHGRSVALETSVIRDAATLAALVGDQAGTREAVNNALGLPAERITWPLMYRRQHLLQALRSITAPWTAAIMSDLRALTPGPTFPALIQAR